MSEITDTLNRVVSKFNADAAADLDAVFQINVDDDDNNYFIKIKDAACNLDQGDHDDPTVTLSMDCETLQGIFSGDIDGMQAFMEGKIRAEGDIMLATRLTELFPRD